MNGDAATACGHAGEDGLTAATDGLPVVSGPSGNAASQRRCAAVASEVRPARTASVLAAMAKATG